MRNGVGEESAATADTPLANVAAHQAGSAEELVAELWRTTLPDAGAGEAATQTLTAELASTVSRVAAGAERIARNATDADRSAARCLAETAAAIGTALNSQPAAVGTAGVGGILPSSVRLRLARMERWLVERAATDPGAEPSANLCLWVLEVLEERAG